MERGKVWSHPDMAHRAVQTEGDQSTTKGTAGRIKKPEKSLSHPLHVCFDPDTFLCISFSNSDSQECSH